MKRGSLRDPAMKMTSDVLYLVLLTLALIEVVLVAGNTHVRINAETPDDVNITYSGTYSHTITDNEATIWEIWPEQKCKNIIEEYAGKAPNFCYLHEPTQGNLYTSNNKPEVTITYEILSISKVKKNTKEVILARKRHENNSNEPFTIKYTLQKTVTDTISHSSYSHSNFSMGGSADFTVFGTAIGFKSEYTHAWGREEQQSNSKSVGVATETTIKVPPYTNTTVTFKTFLVSMTFEITFRTRLEGYVAAYYKPKFESHDFWPFDTKVLPQTRGEKTFKESITINCHQEGNTVVEEQPIVKQSDYYRNPIVSNLHEALMQKN